MSFVKENVQEILMLLEKKHKMGFMNKTYKNLRQKFNFEIRRRSLNQGTILEIMETALESVRKHCKNAGYVGKLSNESCINEKGKSSVKLYNTCYNLLRLIGYKNSSGEVKKGKGNIESYIKNYRRFRMELKKINH